MSLLIACVPAPAGASCVSPDSDRGPVHDRGLEGTDSLRPRANGGGDSLPDPSAVARVGLCEYDDDGRLTPQPEPSSARPLSGKGGVRERLSTRLNGLPMEDAGEPTSPVDVDRPLPPDDAKLVAPAPMLSEDGRPPPLIPMLLGLCWRRALTFDQPPPLPTPVLPLLQRLHPGLMSSAPVPSFDRAGVPKPVVPQSPPAPCCGHGCKC